MGKDKRDLEFHSSAFNMVSPEAFSIQPLAILLQAAFQQESDAEYYKEWG